MSFVVLIAVLVALSAVGCGGRSNDKRADARAATVEPVAGSDVSKVTISEDAARRIDVRVEAVAPAGDHLTQVPYAAVLYDPSGRTWAFVNLEARAFVRQPITIDHIDAKVAFLSAGPNVGTKVVTQGSTEIYGAELGVGDE